jgi:hypothetical protein
MAVSPIKTFWMTDRMFNFITSVGLFDTQANHYDKRLVVYTRRIGS